MARNDNHNIGEYKIIEWCEFVAFDQKTGKILSKLEPPIEIEPYIDQICPLCGEILSYKHGNDIEEWFCSNCGFSSLDLPYIPREQT